MTCTKLFDECTYWLSIVDRYAFRINIYLSFFQKDMWMTWILYWLMSFDAYGMHKYVLSIQSCIIGFVCSCHPEKKRKNSHHFLCNSRHSIRLEVTKRENRFISKSSRATIIKSIQESHRIQNQVYLVSLPNLFSNSLYKSLFHSQCLLLLTK